MPSANVRRVYKLLAAARARLQPFTSRPDQEALDLLAAAWDRPRAAVLSSRRQPSPAVIKKFNHWIRLRRRGRPFAYLVGWQPFLGLRLEVTPATLIPRPATEELVQRVLRDHDVRPLTVVDVGTGSGAIALAMAQARPSWTIVATDISRPALNVARRNARRLELRVTLIHSDLHSKLPPRPDILIANLPYVPTRLLHNNKLRAEPRLALDGGPDGLTVIKKLLAQLHNHPPCELYIECLSPHIRPLRRLIKKRWPTATIHVLGHGRGAFGVRIQFTGT